MVEGGDPDGVGNQVFAYFHHYCVVRQSGLSYAPFLTDTLNTVLTQQSKTFTFSEHPQKGCGGILLGVAMCVRRENWEKILKRNFTLSSRQFLS